MNDAEKMAITKYDLYYESRMTKVESAVENLENDVKEIKKDLSGLRKELKDDGRWILGIVGSIGLILVGLMAHGFKWY